MSDGADASMKGLGIFSTLRLATEFRFFLLAAAFILLLDDVFGWVGWPGLMDLAVSADGIDTARLSLRVILVFVMFSFLTSLALKLTAIITNAIAGETIGRAYLSFDAYLEKALGNDRFPSQRKFEHVRPMELRRAAHEKKDDFYLAQYEEYWRGWIDETKSINENALNAFYVLVLLIVNWSLGRNGAHTIVSTVSDRVESEAYLLFVLAGLAYVFLYRWFERHEPAWIYCPTLYRELEKRDDEAKELYQLR